MRKQCVYTNTCQVSDRDALQSLAERIVTADGTRNMTVQCSRHTDGTMSFAGSGPYSDEGGAEDSADRSLRGACSDLQKILAPGAVCVIANAVGDGISDWITTDAVVVTEECVAMMRYMPGMGSLRETCWWTSDEQARRSAARGSELHILSSPFHVTDREALDSLLAESATQFRPDRLKEPTDSFNFEDYYAFEAYRTGLRFNPMPIALPAGDDGAVVIAGSGPLLGSWPSGCSRHDQTAPSMSEFAARLSRLIAPGNACVIPDALPDAADCADPEPDAWEDCTAPDESSLSGYIVSEAQMHRVCIGSGDMALDGLVLWLHRAGIALIAMKEGSLEAQVRQIPLKARRIYAGMCSIALLVLGQKTLWTEADRAAQQQDFRALDAVISAAALIEDMSEGTAGGEELAQIRRHQVFKPCQTVLRGAAKELENLMDSRLEQSQQLWAGGSKWLETNAFRTTDRTALNELLAASVTSSGGRLTLRELVDGTVRVDGTGRLLGYAPDGTEAVPDRKKFLQELARLIQPGDTCFVHEWDANGKQTCLAVGAVRSTEPPRGKQDACSVIAPVGTDDTFLDDVLIPGVLYALYDACRQCAQDYFDHAFDLSRARRFTKEYDHVVDAYRAMHAVTAAQESGRGLSMSDEQNVRTVLRRSAGIEKDTRPQGEVALCETYVVDENDNVLEYILPRLDPVDEESVQELRDMYDRTDPVRTLQSISPFAGFLGDADESGVAAYALKLMDLWKARRGAHWETNARRSKYAVPEWLV